MKKNPKGAPWLELPSIFTEQIQVQKAAQLAGKKDKWRDGLQRKETKKNRSNKVPKISGNAEGSQNVCFEKVNSNASTCIYFVHIFKTSQFLKK